MSGDSGDKVNLSAVDPSDLARIFSALTRSPITEAMIRADIAAGAPVRPDGRINVMHYLAWLLRERRRGRRPPPPSPG